MKFRYLCAVLALALATAGMFDTTIERTAAQDLSALAKREKSLDPGNYSATPKFNAGTDEPTAVFSGTLTSSDPTFNRPVTCGSLSGVGTATHFDAIPFAVGTAGTVTLSFEALDGGSISPSGTAGQGPDTFFALYSGSFDPMDPLTNCTAVNDDISGATNRRSRISQSLTAGNYVLVVTSFDNTPVTTANNDVLPWTYNLSVIGGVLPTTPGQVIISELRVRGFNPNAASNEFIELYNASEGPLTIQSSDGTSGISVAASDGVIRCTIPNGTLMPARGHFLCTNSVGYALGSYPDGTPDATFTADIPDNAGVAVFSTTNTANFSIATRLDAVGSTSEANTLYREGSGIPALTPFSIDYAFYRDLCGDGGSITNTGFCTRSTSKDSDTNANDLIFVDTNGTSAGAGQRLGAPGPQGGASPLQMNEFFNRDLLDSTVASTSVPNRVRDFTSDPANNSTFGTLDIRRRITNNTGFPVTRLRFRVDRVTTFPAPSGYSDLRPRTSADVVVTGVNDAATCAAIGTPSTTPCSVTVRGTTLEQPPSQPNGGGFNSSMSVGTVTLATPLLQGQSIAIRLLFGIQQTGTYNVAVNFEAATNLPTAPERRTIKGITPGTSLPMQDIGHTENATASDVVITGRVLGYEGRGVTNAKVLLSHPDGSTEEVLTDRLGRFTFAAVESGRTYVISVGSRRFTFDPQVIQVNDNVAGIEFHPSQ